ncbi:MAG: hypothetical protein KDD58_12180 [Bdellovibrionales bacterium]|nr:hypothetical protein [Bdellovibrionales bacterium]
MNENNKIYLDHTWCLDRGHKFHSKLGKMGFTLDKTEVVHPGNAVCRFIRLDSNRFAKFTYLEFIDLKSKKQRYQKADCHLAILVG